MKFTPEAVCCDEGFVTTTAFAPEVALAGALQLISVEEMTYSPGHATPPMVTVAFEAKFVPVIVTGVVMLWPPSLGVTAESVGPTS